jgi:hypothetical protein
MGPSSSSASSEGSLGVMEGESRHAGAVRVDGAGTEGKVRDGEEDRRERSMMGRWGRRWRERSVMRGARRERWMGWMGRVVRPTSRKA